MLQVGAVYAARGEVVRQVLEPCMGRGDGVAAPAFEDRACLRGNLRSERTHVDQQVARVGTRPVRIALPVVKCLRVHGGFRAADDG
ncbi:MAG: hypothetical protein QM651_18320 [Rhodoblastus sp.]